tara:strand:- start:102 stop:614 length:513 start_codon:yes stop_codon:yes gene_type:complete
MTTDEEIRTAQSKVREAYATKPDSALSTSHASAEIGHGLKCVFTQGTETAVMDLPEVMGGTNKGPTPGFHARAAITGCVAIGIKMEAANQGFSIDSIHVGIEMDFDDSAALGMGSNSAAPLATRLVITVNTDHEKSDIQALVAKVLEKDTFFLALRDEQAVTAEIVLDRS